MFLLMQIAKTFKCRRGFTLLEVIISIAVLALISGFILQMFVSSATANKRAKDMDIASMKSINVLELFGAADSYSEFVDAFANRYQNVAFSDGKCELLFDENWEQTTSSQSVNYVMEIMITQTEVLGTKVISAYSADSNDAEEITQGFMYSIDISVDEIEESRRLAGNTAAKYLPVTAEVLQ